MYKINDPLDILEETDVLVFIPFATLRKTGVPTVPDELVLAIPHARKTLEKMSENMTDKDTYHYHSKGNRYLFHRVKSSTKAKEVSIDMLNEGLDILEEVSDEVDKVIIVGTGDVTADDYMKLLFKANNSVFFLERQSKL